MKRARDSNQNPISKHYESLELYFGKWQKKKKNTKVKPKKKKIWPANSLIPVCFSALTNVWDKF